MQTDYFQNIVSTILFVSFKFVVIVLTILLISSLILLAIGCLIKSQKLKTKFLIAIPSIFAIFIFLLTIPYIFLQLRNLIWNTVFILYD